MSTSVSQSTQVAKRTSLWSYFTVPALFVVAYFAARFGIEHVSPGSVLALSLALLPAPFFALLIYAYIRQVRSMDELARRIQLEALTIAFPVALLFVFTIGLLDLAGFHGSQNFDAPRLWPVMLLPYWIAIVLVERRYR